MVPNRYRKILLLDCKNYRFLTPPTHFFADVILEWYLGGRGVRLSLYHKRGFQNVKEDAKLTSNTPLSNRHSEPLIKICGKCVLQIEFSHNWTKSFLEEQVAAYNFTKNIFSLNTTVSLLLINSCALLHTNKECFFRKSLNPY